MNSFLEIFFFFYSFNLSNDDIISLPRIHASCVLCPPLGLQTGMHFRGYLLIGNSRSMKLTQIVKIRVNLSRINFVEH